MPQKNTSVVKVRHNILILPTLFYLHKSRKTCIFAPSKAEKPRRCKKEELKAVGKLYNQKEYGSFNWWAYCLWFRNYDSCIGCLHSIWYSVPDLRHNNFLHLMDV